MIPDPLQSHITTGTNWRNWSLSQNIKNIESLYLQGSIESKYDNIWKKYKRICVMVEWFDGNDNHPIFWLSRHLGTSLGDV